MINWADDLIDDIARRKCVLYLGSGVSAQSFGTDGKSHPSTWDQFLRNIITKRNNELSEQIDIVNRLLDKKDYLLACEIIVDQIGEFDFGSLCADEFRRPGFRAGEIHEVIFSLDSRIVITPNIDKIYEQCAYVNSNGTVVVKKYNEDIAPLLRQRDYIVIKAHGCVDDPTNLIFTHEQYNRARYQYASFYRILDALLLTHTFIFIGCGIHDPDIQLTLENCNFSFPNCKPHYLITSRGSIDRQIAQSLLKNRNIKVLTYENENETHGELLSGLKELTKKVDEKRHELSDSASW